MKLSELGLNDGDLIMIERGTPQSEETFEISVVKVELVDEKEENDEVVFRRELMFKMRVAPPLGNGKRLKEEILKKYKEIEGKEVKSEEIRFRVPRL
jgi:hypothetical protein